LRLSFWERAHNSLGVTLTLGPAHAEEWQVVTRREMHELLRPLLQNGLTSVWRMSASFGRPAIEHVQPHGLIDELLAKFPFLSLI